MADSKRADTRKAPPPGPGGGPRGGYARPKNLKNTVARMFRYIAVKPVLLLLVLACIAAASLANVAATYMMRPIINAITDAWKAGAADVPGLLTSCLTLLGIYALAAVCTYLQANLMAHLAQKGCNRLRRDLFDKLQDLPLSYFDGHTHGELMSRFTNDADNVQMALEQSVVQLFSSAITFVSTVVMMLYLSPVLFLSTLVMLAVITVVFRRRGAKSRMYFKKQQKALGAVNGNIQEMIEGMKVVKAFTHEAEAKEAFGALNEEFREAASNANFYGSSIMPISGAISNMGYAVTAALGGALAVSGFDVGGLVTYLNYNRQITQPLNQISMQMNTILSAMAGAERIFEVMDAKPEVDEGKVVLVPAKKTEDGLLAEDASGNRPSLWAWKTPKDGVAFSLTRAAETDKDVLTEDPNGALWAWKYPLPDGSFELHRIRGAVNPDAGGFILTELRGAVRLTAVDFSYVEGKPVLKRCRCTPTRGSRSPLWAPPARARPR